MTLKFLLNSALNGVVRFNNSLKEEIAQENVSVTSKSIYQSRLNSYEKTLDKLNQPPFPITSEKIQGFLIYKKNNGCTYNTLIA